ncbi:hypothetical protein AC1031_012607 [Aphanomyces cochlioides]|nr:hypothetical protein AC1031_012607 [Aphanomyces cochlioides]
MEGGGSSSAKWSTAIDMAFLRHYEEVASMPHMVASGKSMKVTGWNTILTRMNKIEELKEGELRTNEALVTIIFFVRVTVLFYDRNCVARRATHHSNQDIIVQADNHRLRWRQANCQTRYDSSIHLTS